MGFIQNNCFFQHFTSVLFIWTILTVVKASQNDTVSSVDEVASNSTNVNCSSIQLNGQTLSVAGNDTNANDVDIPLSEGLFEFAQLFSLVNFK